MSLSSALRLATSALTTRQGEIAVTSRNIAGANQAGYTRKTAELATVLFDGAPLATTIARIERAEAPYLFAQMNAANAAAGAATELVNGMQGLQQTLEDPEKGLSPGAKIGRLFDALKIQATKPGDANAARSTFDAARTVATTLVKATQTVQGLRTTADADIAAAVGDVNALLARFEALNREVVRGTVTRADVTEAEDQRDQVITALSRQMGITTFRRANNDMVIVTDSGVTLFETIPRSVTFVPTPLFGPATVGNAVLVDGVQVTGPAAQSALQGGRLKGLSDLRDTVAPGYQAQLDEIARAVIEAFQETDQTSGGNPPATGLFSWSGSPAVPATGARIVGLAGEIAVAPAVDPAAGGQLMLIRDGGIAGAVYSWNPAGLSGFTDRLHALMDEFLLPRPFDTSVSAVPTMTLNDFAASTASWLEARRKAANSLAEENKVTLSRTRQAVANGTGVNLDEELQTMLDIENAYAASAKLLGTVNRLFDTLMAIAR